MQRIAHIIGQLSWGGAERQVFELASRLPAQGFEPLVYCLSEATTPYREMLEAAGVPVRVFPRRSHFDLNRVWALRRALDRDRIGLAQAWLVNDDAYTAAAHLLSPRPWIASMRSRPFDLDPVRKRITRWAMKRATRVIANQSEVVDYLATELGCSGSHVRLIYNGIDLDRLLPHQSREQVRASLDTPMDVPVLLFAGRLEEVKRVDLLLTAFKIVLVHHHGARLWIAGDGSLASSLREHSHTLDLGQKVVFLGVRPDLPDLLHAADLFVLCSESEGLPNVVLESMGCGTPALVTTGCGCQDLIDPGVNGWVAPANHPGILARMMTGILGSPGGLRLAGTRAVTTVREGYSVEQMVARMAGLYRELLEERPLG